MEDNYTVFVRDLQSRTICLSVSRTDCLRDLKASLQASTGIPVEEQCIIGRRCLDDATCLMEQGIAADTTLHLSGRLRGGKGGFGSLLRGSGKTAMTENEDACRDLSGRRLRLVNADKKLQDWAAAEKQRRDEKEAAKEERNRVKAESRAEVTQTNLEAIRKDQNAVLSSVAKALESSRKVANKRSAPEKDAKPAMKKTRYSSDSENDSEEEEEEEDEEEETTDQEFKNAAANATREDSEIREEVAVAVGSSHSPVVAAPQIGLAT